MPDVDHHVLEGYIFSHDRDHDREHDSVAIIPGQRNYRPEVLMEEDQGIRPMEDDDASVPDAEIWELVDEDTVSFESE